MQKIELTKRDFIFLGILSVLASFFTVVWMAITGNMPQVYNDIVYEITAMVRGNKSAEISLLRILVFLGSAAVFCYVNFWGKNDVVRLEKTVNATGCFIAYICVVVLFKFVFFANISYVLCFALCVVGISYATDRRIGVFILVQYFLSYYVVFAIYHTCNFLGSYGIAKVFHNMKNIDEKIALVFAVLCSVFPLLFKNRLDMLKKTILIMQLFLPSLFLILSLKEYNFNGGVVNIGIPLAAKIFVALAFSFTFINSFFVLKKNWKKIDFEIGDLISIGSCIVILCFNFYGGQMAVLTRDLHHPFEDIFAFQQIFQLGQLPYKDFIPPSGLYSVVQGFFFWLFGKGEIGYLSLAYNIFFFVVWGCVIFLLKFHVDKIVCFAVAIFLPFPGYNRVVFSSIIVLLFLHPNIVEKPNLWLKLFLLLSLFHGLYYPVYGVACFVGFIPMCVCQFKKILSDKKAYSGLSFLLPWVCVCIILISSIPLLWGTFVHVLAMSEQSVLADGIPMFGQKISSTFMPYAKEIIRYPIYNSIRVVPLAVIVWLPILFFLKVIKNNQGENKGKFDISINFVTITISLIFIPIVSYSYSFVRLDKFNLFARTWLAIIVDIVLFIVFIFKYMKNNLSRLFCLVFLNIFIVLQWGGVGVETNGWKMFSKMNVPNDYHLSEKGEFEVETVGRCFLPPDIYKLLAVQKEKLKEIDARKSFSKLSTMGVYYIFEQPAGANIEDYTVRGFRASKETRNVLLNNKMISGGVDPLSHYYLFNWLISSGEYVWDEIENSFIPNEGKPRCECVAINRGYPFFQENYNLGNSADVFGLSFKSLKKNFIENEETFSIKTENDLLRINFETPVYGNDMDFVYLQYDPIENECQFTEHNDNNEAEVKYGPFVSRLFLKKRNNPKMMVFVHFFDEEGMRHTVYANYGNGKLLVNLGAGKKYLLEKHREFEVEIQKDGIRVPSPKLSEVMFLKCRPIY